MYVNNESERRKELNIAILMGRLTKDPVVGTSQSGTISARFTLAVDRHSKTDPNAADFPSCVCFGKTAEIARDYLKKGVKVAVQGRIQTSKYPDENGKEVYRTDVVVLGIEFCERKQQDGGQAQTQGNAPQAQPQNYGQPQGGYRQNGQNQGYGQTQGYGGYAQPNRGGYQSRGEYQQQELPFN